MRKLFSENRKIKEIFKKSVASSLANLSNFSSLCTQTPYVSIMAALLLITDVLDASGQSVEVLAAGLLVISLLKHRPTTNETGNGIEY